MGNSPFSMAWLSISMENLGFAIAEGKEFVSLSQLLGSFMGY